MQKRIVFLPVFLTVLSSVPGRGQSNNAAGGALPAEAVAEEVTFRGRGEVFVSPNGKLVAYTTSKPGQTIAMDHPEQEYARSGYPLSVGWWLSDLWVSNITTGEIRRVGSDVGSSWGGAWSPDGKAFAFYSDRTGTASLWVWDEATSKSRQVSGAMVHTFLQSEVPMWSPDGKKILTKLMVENMTIEQLFELNPNYKRPAAVAKVQDNTLIQTQDQNHSTVRVLHSAGTVPGPAADPKVPAAVSAAAASDEEPEGQIYQDLYFLSDLGLIDVQSGAVNRIVRRTRASWYAFSPDGQFIGFASQEGILPRSQTSVATLFLYSLHDGNTRTLVRSLKGDLGPRVSLSWSPDGTRIAYATSGVRSDHGCYTVRVNDGAITKVSSAISSQAEDFSARPPLWNAQGDALYLLSVGTGRLWKVSADGKSAGDAIKIPGRMIRDVALAPNHASYWSPGQGDNMMVVSLDPNSQSNGFYQVDLATGQATEVLEGGMRFAYTGGGAKGASQFVYEAEDAAHAPDLWTIDAASKQNKRLSKLNPRYDAASLGSARTVEWISMEGEHLRGALLLPAGYQEGKRYPVLTWVYGGMNGSDYWNAFGFGWGATFNMQMLASRGYAVFYPDIPMHKGTPVHDLVSSVIPGVNKLIEMGIADPDKLAVEGQSFGGYNTMSLITSTTRFKAAIASASAFINIFEGYSYFAGDVGDSTGYYEEGQGGLGGTPWTMRNTYIENSPFFTLDKVTTPVMLECGKNDDLCQSNGEMFVALRRLGKEVDFLQYDGEGHVPLGRANIIDFWNRRIEFLDKHLGVQR